jgi:regulator of ribonuclease activity A
MTISTPDLCDAHEGHIDVIELPFRNYGGQTAFSGEIVTVKCFEDNSRVKELLNTPGAGRVLVVDGGGSLRKALLGDMIAESAVKNGWSGVVVYGAIRDVDAIAASDLGVQALGSTPLKTERKGLGEVGLPLRLAGIVVKPGAFLYADNNGVIVADHSLL